MIDAFEARLADWMTDALSGVAALQLVTRPRSDVELTANRVAAVVRVLHATAAPTVGDDARERMGRRGQYQLRTTLHLEGRVAVDLIIDPTGGDNVADRRQVVTSVLDRLLVATQADAVRTGRAFATADDRGFDISGFRLARITPPEETPESFSTVRVLYDFVGRFWPVEAPGSGDHIVALPSRVAVLPVHVPEHLQATAGANDLRIPLRMDLRSLGGASLRVIARMKGAAPPGSLIGDTADVPPGNWVGYVPDAEGIVVVVYRPPATLAGGPVRVEVETALSRPSLPSVFLAGLSIEVAA